MDDDRYLVVSADSHAGPALVGQLREYCPREHLDEFDEYAQRMHALAEAALAKFADLDEDDEDDPFYGADATRSQVRTDPRWAIWPDATKRSLARTKDCAGLQDPAARVADMDAEGVAVDVIFAGGQNGQGLPFLGAGLEPAGPPSVAQNLRALGHHIWNAWLADFVAHAPERHIGVLQMPIWDVEAAVKEVEWASDAGLKAVNLPAPRADFPPYYDDRYERLWEVCAERRLALVTHAGAGPTAHDPQSRLDAYMHSIESKWFSNRATHQLIFSGVFERHPQLRFVSTETGASWAPEMLRELDATYASYAYADLPGLLPRRPSEYWHEHCFLSGSFLARFEVALRDQIGTQNMLWGTDYPHSEGTWPHSRVAMRHTFWDVPEPVTRQILGENAVGVFDLELDKVRAVAARIGPRPSEIAVAPSPEEYPDHRGFAYRELGYCA